MFLDLPNRIYAQDANYIRPLDQDIEAVFNPAKNKFWEHGRAIRWVLLNDAGEAIARVAAFVDKERAGIETQPTGGMGFFECIDDQKAAHFLFDTCRDWLKEQGMEAMDGPINFGGRNAWWGLLVEGFHEPVYQMNYNLPYYVDLFESYGWETYFKQLAFQRDLQKGVAPVFAKIHDRVVREGGYDFRPYEKSKLKEYGEDFFNVYNQAWADHSGFKEMRREEATKLFKTLKPILAPELCWFGYHHDKPVCFFIMIPDMNQLFKDFNGKFGLVQKLKTWWRLRRRVSNKCYGIAFGVIPEYQRRGTGAALIHRCSTAMVKAGFWDHMEMVWVGDFNTKMLPIAKGVGGDLYKTYHTKRYLFDRSLPFERMPFMDEEDKKKD